MKRCRKLDLEHPESQPSLTFKDKLYSDKIYTPAEVAAFLITSGAMECKSIGKRGKGSYLNIPAAFDIETTSFLYEDKKSACMYVWMLGIGGCCMMGRTWEEFIDILMYISEKLALDPEGDKLLIYVHSLAYEMQWFRKWQKWYKVFSTDVRKPLFAISTLGIEYRCSYLQTGYSLAEVGKHLTAYPIKKLVGDLDYTLPRHPETALTPKEIGYCINDIKVVMSYIQEQIEIEGDITHIPLTKTGYVRRFCRNACFFGMEEHKQHWKRKVYHDLMLTLRLRPDEYLQAKRAFMGGYTHGSAFKVKRVIYDAAHKDEASAYPLSLILEQMPMSEPVDIIIKSKNDMDKQCKLYAILTDVEFKDLESTFWADHYISQSHCRDLKGAVIDNGRVVSAKSGHMTITDPDWWIISKTYRGKFRFYNTRRYVKDYLPTDLVKAILELYRAKTELKGVDGAELEYALKKAMLNSTFGMCVTDICRPEIEYDEGWLPPAGNAAMDLAVQIYRYNESQSRFLSYLWGVWCTSYSRAHLWAAILHLKGDYIYSDTDSVFYRHKLIHEKWFNKYNAHIRSALDTVMDYHGIPREATRPQTIKGKPKQLGIWEDEDPAYEFKTLGAKRYLQRFEKGHYIMTVSGLNKRVAVPYMQKKYKSKMMAAFDEGLYVPKGKTGKMVHDYLDDPVSAVLTDYKGDSRKIMELSAVYMEPADYSLSLSREYADFISMTQYSAGHNLFRL